MILVTGATGNVGKHIVSQLAEGGQKVRALTRDLARLEARSPLVEWVQGDLDQKETVLPALKDVKKMFLLIRSPVALELVQMAAEAGVEHIVLLSSSSVLEDSAGVTFNARRHLVVEQAIQAAGLKWTFVRPGAFATNALQWAANIRQESAVHLPYPEAHLASVHEADIAAVSAAALTEEDMAGKAFHLTGPTSLTQREMVATIGTVLGKSLHFDELSPDQYRESGQVPPQYADVLLKHWSARNGIPAQTTDAVEGVTGRPARSFAQWATDHKADFA